MKLLIKVTKIDFNSGLNKVITSSINNIINNPEETMKVYIENFKIENNLTDKKTMIRMTNEKPLNKKYGRFFYRIFSDENISFDIESQPYFEEFPIIIVSSIKDKSCKSKLSRTEDIICNNKEELEQEFYKIISFIVSLKEKEDLYFLYNGEEELERIKNKGIVQNIHCVCLNKNRLIEDRIIFDYRLCSKEEYAEISL